MRFFKTKDKNKVNGEFISDVLIKLTISLMGQNKEKVDKYFANMIDIHETVTENGVILIYSMLNNGCAVGVSIENDIVYKINIYLNNKPSKEDVQNLKIFESAHNDEYIFVLMFEENVQKHLIGFESKLY